MIARDNPPFQIEFLSKIRKLSVGETHRLQFKLTDPLVEQPRNDLEIRTLTFLVPGIWQKLNWAQFVADGVYEIDLSVPHSGTYYVFFESPSLNIRYNQLPHLVLQASHEKIETGNR